MARHWFQHRHAPVDRGLFRSLTDHGEKSLTHSTQSPAAKIESVPLAEIARVFLVIGVTGFGEGMAVIALIQDACVTRRRWLSTEEFSHGIAFGQLLGPFAVNIATFVGYRLQGVAGAVTAAVSFAAPSVFLVIALSALYFRFHTMPALQSALAGIGPVVVALIVSAAWRMGRGKVRTVESVTIALIAGALLHWKVPIALILLLTAAYGTVRHGIRRKVEA